MLYILPTTIMVGLSSTVLTSVTLHDAAAETAIIVGLIVTVITLIGGVYGVKYKTAAKVAETNAQLYREQSEVYHEKAEKLEQDKNEALKVISSQREVIQKLESLPNLARVIELMQTTAERQDQHAQARINGAMRALDDMIEAHERRAEERHLALLQKIHEIHADK